MNRLFMKLSVILLFIFIAACSSPPPADASIKEGRDYEIVPAAKNALSTPTAPNNKIYVVEFFSYGCPWCYHFEPDLEKWVANKPNDITFEKVPVVFEEGWETLAKVYYTAKNLGVANKLSLPIFEAVQKKEQDFTNDQVVSQFFVAHGVSEQDFNSAFNFSPGIDAQMMRADQLMRQYGVYEIPTIVVNGKYFTNMRMADGDSAKMLRIVDYLIAKQRQQQGVN